MNATALTQRKHNSSLENIFVDRELEIHAIKEEYLKVMDGQRGLVCVAGVPGVGKTYLLEYAFRQLGHNTIVHGKSCQNEKGALTSIIEVMDGIVDHLLTLPTETLEIIVAELSKNIAGDMALLASISPKISSLVREIKQENIRDLNRLKYRIKNAIYKLVSVAAKYLFPLVIYIDDVQWADPLSVDIMTTLINKKQVLNVMLALSFRDNETNKTMQKLMGILENKATMIALKPLSSASVKEYIRIFLKGKVNDLDRLASLIQSLTLGNPFFVKETLIILLEEKLILYSETDDTWGVNIDRIDDFLISDDVESIIKKRIDAGDDHDLLALICCLDGKVEYDILKQVYNGDELDARLNALIDAFILIQHHRSGSDVLLFAHDIILKIVDNSLDPNYKQAVHYMIADTLRQGVASQTKQNLIVSQLLRASTSAVYEHADMWIEILFDAGIEEKQRASLDVALRIFEMCIDILPGCARTDHFFFIQLHLELAECLCLCKRYSECTAMIDMLMKQHPDKASLLAIKSKQLYIYHYQREHEKTLKTGIEILKTLNFGFGRYRLPLDLIVARFVYSNKKIKRLADAPDTISEKESIILDTLTIMNACAAVSDDALTAPIGLSAALVSAKCGSSANSLVGYISYAYVLYTVFGDLNKAKMLVLQILEMCIGSRDHSSKSMVYFMIGAFLSHWWAPLEETDYYLQRSIEYGESTGDFPFLGYSIATSLDTKSFMGSNLDFCLRYIEDLKEKYFETEQYTTTYNYAAHKTHILALKQGNSDYSFDRIARAFPKLTPFEMLTEQALLLEELLFKGELVLGYELVQTIAPHVQLTKGLICYINIVFYSVIIQAGVHAQLKKAERRGNLRSMKRMLGELRQWAHVHSHNFGGICLLAEAEYETHIRKRPTDRYEHAIDYAGKRGNLRLEALANLLAARKNTASKKLSRFYASESVKLSKIWGADHICQTIAQEFELTEDKAPSVNPQERTIQAPLLHTFIKASQGLQEEETTTLLLETVINAGFADYCCVILERSQQLYLIDQMSRNVDTSVYTDKININNLNRLPHKVIRYAARTGKEVYLAPNQYHPIFANDTYIANNPGAYIACLPIFNCHVFVGMIYLENRDAPFDENTMLEIKSLLPLYVSALPDIKEINIKEMFSPIKTQRVLTKREMDIMKLLAQGLSNEQIGTKLGLSVGTIKKHMSSIMAKLDADNRIKALIKAKDMQIV